MASSRTPSATGSVLLAIGITLALLIAQAIGVLSPLHSLVGVLVKPATALFRPGKSELEKENQQLRDQLHGLQQEVARREEAKQENDSLRASLNFAQSNNFN